MPSAIQRGATFLRQLEMVSGRLAEEPDVSDGCGCAPELPLIDAVQLQRDLSIELPEDPDKTIEKRRNHRDHQHT